MSDLTPEARDYLAVADPDQIREFLDERDRLRNGADLRSFSEIEPEPVEWLWRKRIPRGELSVISGHPKQGKSLFMVWLASEVARGGGKVFLITLEDSAGTVRDRLDRSGADISRVFHVPDVTLPSSGSQIQRWAVQQQPDLLIVDPYDFLFDDHINAHNRQQVRGALSSLLSVSRRHNTAILLVSHLNRSNEDEHPIHRVPAALRGLARSILTMKRDEEATILEHPWCNYGASQPPITFTFEAGTLHEKPSEAAGGLAGHREGSSLIFESAGFRTALDD